MPHRINLWDDLARIKDVGYETWFQEMVDRYACPECGAINSAYDLACRKCGCEPGNEYVKAHREAIEKFMSAMMNPGG
jgi:ribosomal protein L40E